MKLPSYSNISPHPKQKKLSRCTILLYLFVYKTLRNVELMHACHHMFHHYATVRSLVHITIDLVSTHQSAQPR
jgi:hypothetical protein